MTTFPEQRGLLALNAERIRLLAAGLPPEQARWRPDPASWSVLEVVNHLYDEEREDFRVRLDYILHRPGETAPPIDPEAWVLARRYNERDLAESLDNFLAERRKSLAWLESLGEPNWEIAVETPGGARRAGDMFNAWLAHDFLHLRQLVELGYLYLRESARPYAVDYAGEW